MNAEIYTGKATNGNIIESLGVTGNLVVRLVHELQGQNYTIFTDRFYTSVKLAEYLMNLDIQLCGTAMTNRKDFPKALIKKNNEIAKGESVILFNGKVAALVWKDKRPIYFVSSVYGNSPQEFVLRYDSNEHRRMPVAAPKIVRMYNENMGGTDKNDQVTKLQKCRRHYRWPRRLFVKFFLWAGYNAYIQMNFKKPHALAGRRVVTFHKFMESICEEYVAPVRTVQSAMARRVSSHNEERRLNRDAHHDAERPASATGNNRCRVCSDKYLRAKRANPHLREKDLPKRSRTVNFCTYCQEFLCIGNAGANCWYDWHHKLEFWH
jgi:hypothetical protein